MIDIYANKFILIYISVLSFILGSIFGSFLNCVAGRIAINEAWWKGRSKCDYCNHKLGLLDLVPIFSYIFFKGKCRYCGKKISIKYLFSELILGLLFLLFVLIYGKLDINLLNYLGLICILYGLSLCDLNTYEIPNGFIIFGVLWWLLFEIINKTAILDILINILLAFIVPACVLLISIIMDKVLKKESMGGGDIKLLFLVSLYLSLILSIFNLMFSCIIGLVFILLTKKEKIPFGPSISLATYISLIYGANLVTWYFSLFI